MTQSHMQRLGVDAGKESVRKTFGDVIDNDFPGAWVNIVRDMTRQRGWVFTQHMDGDGSKFIQRILTFREIGDVKVFRGAVDDALSMNMGDIAASGFTSGIIAVTDVININGFNVPKDEIMEQIKIRLGELKELYRAHGFRFYVLGGETADLPHQVQTVAFDVAVHARAREKDIITGNVRPGDIIWGFASDGRALWEEEVNSGLMSNGSTLARMCTMSRQYTKRYPDLVRLGGTYEGRFFVDDEGEGGFISQALLSPTRQWAILIKILLDKLKERELTHLLHGITMNTGGGATKIAHLGKGGILYQKQMPDPPILFHVIQRESKESWRDMFKGFNCGVGIDVIGDEKLRPVLEEVAEETLVVLYHLGCCLPWDGKGNKVELETRFGRFDDY